MLKVLNYFTLRSRLCTDFSVGLDYWVARATLKHRTDIPTHATWSSDGSILAVALGPNVALYDPHTTALIQTLASPECIKVTSTAFIGRGSRYLAVSGHRDVILWDLVSQSGKYSPQLLCS